MANKLNDQLPEIPNQTHMIHFLFHSGYCNELLLNNISKWLLSNKFCNLSITVSMGVKPLISFIEFFRFTYFDSLDIQYKRDVQVKYKERYNQELNYIESFLDVFKEKCSDVEIKSSISASDIGYDD